MLLVGDFGPGASCGTPGPGWCVEGTFRSLPAWRFQLLQWHTLLTVIFLAADLPPVELRHRSPICRCAKERRGGRQEEQPQELGVPKAIVFKQPLVILQKFIIS